jgi:twitching motility protein PilT
MSLRDAEAMILEPGKVPSLRRRGQIEALAMPALDAQLLTDFAEPLTAGRSSEEWPALVSFSADGAAFAVTIDKLASGYRVVVRKAGKPAAVKPPAIPRPAAPAARPDDDTDPALDVPNGRGAPIRVEEEPNGVRDDEPPRVVAHARHDLEAPMAQPRSIRAALARLAELLAAPLATAKLRGASDLTLSTGQPPRARIDGRIEPLDHEIDDGELAACVEGFRDSPIGISADHSAAIAGLRVRVNLFDHMNGYGIAARLIRDRVPSIADLALPPEIASVMDHRDGLVLVGGPTGSGKTTTLATLIDALDQKRAAHVITLEDPIEYQFSARRCLIHQRELGVHIPTFADGLRAALREAPDVILLGELRDRETLAAALTAAETGHLVLATLHAPNAAGAIDRMIDAFPEAQQRQVRWQLAGVLRTVITQFLLPRRDGGRVPAIEFVPATPAVANIIRKGDLHTLPTAIQAGRDAGMIPLERSLAKLMKAGTVAPQVIKKIAADHDLLAALT